MYARRLDGQVRLGIALVLLVFAAPPASACGWWGCGDRAYTYRPPVRGYGYRSPTQVYGYPYYGYLYAARPSTTIAPTRAYLASAPPLPNATAVGLTVPIATAEGLLEGGLPARGPTLFGPTATPPAFYAGYYYSAPGSSYTYRGPPPPTAWLERRRRR